MSVSFKNTLTSTLIGVAVVGGALALTPALAGQNFDSKGSNSFSSGMDSQTNKGGPSAYVVPANEGVGLFGFGCMAERQVYDKHGKPLGTQTINTCK